MNASLSRPLVLVAAGIALACAGFVAILLASSWFTQDSEAVDDLPTVAEVIVAQAHRHGIELPELTDEQLAALASDSRSATDASAYEQLSTQLLGVLGVDGLDQAVFLLGEVAAVSPDAAQLCPQLFDELVASAPSSSSPASPC